MKVAKGQFLKTDWWNDCKCLSRTCCKNILNDFYWFVRVKDEKDAKRDKKMHFHASLKSVKFPMPYVNCLFSISKKENSFQSGKWCLDVQIDHVKCRGSFGTQIILSGLLWQFSWNLDCSPWITVMTVVEGRIFSIVFNYASSFFIHLCHKSCPNITPFQPSTGKNYANYS